MIEIYSRVLGFANWGHREKPSSVPKKKEKLEVLTVKSTSLRMINSAFLALDWSKMLSVRCQAVRMIGAGGLACPGGLDNGCQVNVYMSPSGGKQVAWIHEYFRG